MNKLKNLFTVFLIISQTHFFAQSEPETKRDELVWMTDLAKANGLSNSTKKPIFAFFTGSDWCGWCKKIQKDVFSKKEFIDWAKKNVVLLELDFPRRTQLDPQLVQQNNGLQQAFQVTGYPTIWMFYLNKDEKTMQLNISALGSLGYPSGAKAGKEEVQFLKQANSILKKGTTKS